MQSEIHPYVINQQNSSQQVRQNLISEPNPPQLQIQNLPILPPILGSLQQSNIRVNLSQNIQTTQLINYLQTRRIVIPFIPISKYKYFTEILMFFTCFIEMVFFQCTFIHAIWFLWYPILGFHRHSMLNRKIRFFGEFIHILLWVVTNCYIFSQHKVGLFPMIFLIANMDYYFMGFNLIFTYFCFISYILYNWCADFRLKIIVKKLSNRRKELLQNQLTKFAENQKKYQSNMINQSNQQSVQRMEKQIEQKQEQKNMCPICLTQLTLQQRNFEEKYFEVLRLSCSHRYHYGCLKSWIQTEQQKCPVCRAQIFL